MSKDKSIELLESKLKHSNDVKEQQQLDLTNLQSKYDTLMDQNKVLEETLLNKETTIRKQKDIIDYQEKELIDKQNASEVQQKSIKDYRESIYTLNVQLEELNNTVATLEAKVQKAVSNSNFAVRKRRSNCMYGNRNKQKSIIFEGANTSRTC